MWEGLNSFEKGRSKSNFFLFFNFLYFCISGALLKPTEKWPNEKKKKKKRRREEEKEGRKEKNKEGTGTRNR